MATVNIGNQVATIIFRTVAFRIIRVIQRAG